MEISKKDSVLNSIIYLYTILVELNNFQVFLQHNLIYNNL